MLGKVLENIIGFDNKIRAVKLKQGNGAIEYHSISNLYPMEISCPQNDSQIVSSWVDVKDRSNKRSLDRPSPTVNNIDSCSTNKVLVQPKADISVRPKRKATAKFHQMMKEKIDYQVLKNNKCCCNIINK